MNGSVSDFEAHRPSLLALAYRMLGDFGRAEDVVQEAWLRFQRSQDPARFQRSQDPARGQPSPERLHSPRAYLVKVVTRLCLNELTSARARREESRADRLPEPIQLDEFGLSRVEILDQVSMAFLVLLQRLTPAERAALLLHDVFDFDYTEIASLLHKTEPACRQLLKRAREHVEVERRSLTISQEEHRRLLRAFVAAATTGDVTALKSMLASDVVLVADAGPSGGTYGRTRNLPGPLVGRDKVAAFVASVGPQGADGICLMEHELNGQPALVIARDGQPFTVIMLAVMDGAIRSVFMHADLERLQRVGSVLS